MQLTEWDWHVGDALTIAKTFIAESQYPVSYSQTHALEHLWAILNSPNSAILLVYQDDEIAGGALVHKDNGFHSEFIGYLTKFYIMPRGRGTSAARDLMQEITGWFDTNACAVSIAGGAAGIGQNQAFNNLLKKFGYKDFDRAMIRERENK